MSRLYKLINYVMLFALPVLGVLWVANIPQQLGLPWVTPQVVATALGISVGIIFLSNPYSSKYPFLNLTLALIGMLSWAWYAWNYEDWTVTIAYRTPDMWIPGICALLFLLEALRKSVGLSIALLVWGVIAYGFFGDYIPGPLQAQVMRPTRTILYLYADPNGVPGLVLTVIVTLVLPFVVFGKVMEISGGMRFFNDLAFGLMGHKRGGPAKVAVVASGFFGTLSGSTVANIMSTGIITIPMMVKSGFRKSHAAAIEAVASNGGQIMPPIMGATAFIMAEFLQIPYSDVVKAAAVPAILYYLVLIFKIDAIAKRDNISGIDKEELPSVKRTLLDGWIVVIPLLYLFYLLFDKGYNPGLAALMSSALMFGGYLLKIKFKVDIKDIFELLLESGKEIAPLLLIGGAAGAVIGMLNSTGFAFQLSLLLSSMAHSYGLFVLLILTAIVSIILGMGMPTAAVYIILVTVVAPSLIDFGVEPLSAHLFLFYFGLMSMITPPIAIGSIVAAKLAKADLWETGYQGMRFGLAAYLLPFLWVYNPALLLKGSTTEITLVITTTFVAAYLLKQSMFHSPWMFVPDWMHSLFLVILALLSGSATVYLAPDSFISLVPSGLAILYLQFLKYVKAPFRNRIESA